MSVNSLSLVGILSTGVYRVESRTGGGEWSPSTLMTGGVNDQFSSFTNDLDADELRITMSSITPFDVDRLHLARVSQVSGLSFLIESGNNTLDARALSCVAEDLPTRRAVRKRNYHLRFPQQTNVKTIRVTISGIVGGLLDIRQIAFGLTGWTPNSGYVYGSSQKRAASVRQSRTRRSKYQQADDRHVTFTANFEDLSEAEDLDLINFLDMSTVNGFCIYEHDAHSTEHHKSYFAQVSATPTSFAAFNMNPITLTLDEAFA